MQMVNIGRKDQLSRDGCQYLKLAEDLLTTNIGKSFSLLCLGLSLDSSQKEKYYQLFFSVLETWSNILLGGEKYDDALKLFDVSQDLYSNSVDLSYLLSCVLLRLGKTREALEYVLKCFNQCRTDPRVCSLLAEITNALVDRWHYPMINDEKRNKAYDEAIQNAVAMGYVDILDIGSGSGLLSLYAHRCGAHSVVGCEENEFMFELSESILKANLASNVVMLNRHSSKLKFPDDLPNEVNLVITETFDSGLFGEHILPTLHHVWTELFKTDPTKNASNMCSTDKIKHKVIPSHAEVYICIIQCEYIARQTKTLLNSSYLKRNVVLQTDEPYLSEKLWNIPGGFSKLTEWKQVLEVDFNSLDSIQNIMDGSKSSTIDLVVSTEGRADCFALAYRLHLNECISVDTFPTSDMCWENAIYPIGNFHKYIKGETIQAEMTYNDYLNFNLVSNMANNVIQTDNVSMLKCLNSLEYRLFYSKAAKKFTNKIGEDGLSNIKILDVCPFPEGGLKTISICEKSKLYVENERMRRILSDAGHAIYVNDNRETKFDYIFYWPFTNEGTLKDNLMEEIQSYREMLQPAGLFFPVSIDLHMVAIDSAQLLKMTRVDDKNTHGTKISQIFNMFKTRHHLDIPLKCLKDLHTISTILSPISINLNESGSDVLTGSSTSTYIRNQKGIDSTQNTENIQEGATKNPIFLSIGGNLFRTVMSFESITDGNINGFAYWFELSGETKLLKEKTEKCGVVGSNDMLFDDSLAGLVNKTSNLEENKSVMAYNFLDEQQTMPKSHEYSNGGISDIGENKLLFSTLGKNLAGYSALNQCILLLDDSMRVCEKQTISLNIYFCNGVFCVDVNK